MRPARRGLSVVMFAHPLDESGDIRIAPHPAWETLERLPARAAGRSLANVSVDRRGVRPICFDGNGRKAVLLNQAARDRGSRLVELRRAVAGFPKQDNPRGREAIKASLQIRPATLSRSGARSSKLTADEIMSWRFSVSGWAH